MLSCNAGTSSKLYGLSWGQRKYEENMSEGYENRLKEKD